MEDYNNKTLDISWLSAKEKELEEYDNTPTPPLPTPPLPTSACSLFHIHINTNNEIESVSKEIIKIHDQRIIKDDILKIIPPNKTKNGKKYKLHEILLYNPSISSTPSIPPLKKIQYIHDIVITHEEFISHKINTLYFIYHEKERIQTKPLLKIY
jgi:hypothetical protein